MDCRGVANSVVVDPNGVAKKVAGVKSTVGEMGVNMPVGSKSNSAAKGQKSADVGATSTTTLWLPSGIVT